MEALRNHFLKLGLTKTLSIVGVTLGTLIFFAFLALRTSEPELGLLFANLDPSDASKISEKLKVMNIPYTIKGEASDQIFAQKNQISKLRMELAADGLPAGGTIGYELFDKNDLMGTSSAMLDINMLRATEGEIAKSIRTIQGVLSARVHLVLPKKELFSQEKSMPSASVLIKMKGTSRLSVNQVLAIQHLVASAIPELALDRISIIDDKGTLLAKGTDSLQQQMSNLTQMELKNSYESKVARSIESLLENTVGPGKIRAEVNVEMDFDQISTQSVEYNPDGQVARSSQSTNEGSNSNESALSDTTTIQNNQPQNANSGPTNQSKNQDTRSEENVSYEISNTTKTHVKESGTVKRVSIAILVDGLYEKDKDGKSVYKARTEADIKELTELAKTASGFDEKRGDVIKITNMKFNDPPAEPEATTLLNKLMNQVLTSKYIENFVIFIMGLILYFKVIKPYALQVAGAAGFVVYKRPPPPPPPPPPVEIEKPKKEVPIPEEEPEEFINIENIDGRMKSSSIKKVGEIIQKHPEETISIIRSWMYS